MIKLLRNKGSEYISIEWDTGIDKVIWNCKKLSVSMTFVAIQNSLFLLSYLLCQRIFLCYGPLYCLGGRKKNNFDNQKNNVFKLHVNQIILDNPSLPENNEQQKRDPKTPIYINKSLTPDKRQFLKKASEKAKEKITNTKGIPSREKCMLKKVVLVSITQFNVTLALTKLFEMVKSFL